MSLNVIIFQLSTLGYNLKQLPKDIGILFKRGLQDGVGWFNGHSDKEIFFLKCKRISHFFYLILGFCELGKVERGWGGPI